MPGSLEALIVIALFLVPGYIMMLVNLWLSAPRWPTGYAFVINMVTFGLLNTVVAATLVAPWWHQLRDQIVPLCGSYENICGPQAVFFAVMIFGLGFVLPTLLGIGLAGLRNKGTLQTVEGWLVPLLGGRRREDAWDALFDRPRDKPLWVHAYLKDGRTVYEGLTDHVSEQPSEKALILTDVSVRRHTGDWEKLEADYVLLSGDDIRAIEAYE